MDTKQPNIVTDDSATNDKSDTLSLKELETAYIEKLTEADIKLTIDETLLLIDNLIGMVTMDYIKLNLTEKDVDTNPEILKKIQYIKSKAANFVTLLDLDSMNLQR